MSRRLRRRDGARPQARTTRWDVRAAVCLALAALAFGAGAVAALSHATQRRSGTNGVKVTRALGAVASFCQGSERLARDTVLVGIALSPGEAPGPALSATLSRHGRQLAAIGVPAGWTSTGVYLPVNRTTRDYDDVDLCVRALGGGTVTLVGERTPPHVGSVSGKPGVSIRTEDYRPGTESWWSFFPVLATRLGLGRGSWGGGWVAWLLAALVLASWALAARVVLRTIVAREDDAAAEPPGDAVVPARSMLARAHAALQRLPGTARALVAIAVLNALAWSLITPPFHVPDEITHVAYAQEIAETGSPPVHKRTAVFSPALLTLMADTHGGRLNLGEESVAIWTQSEERRLEHDVAKPLSGRGNGNADASDTEPPLYYAYEAIPYELARGGTMLERFQLMRLASTLLAGLTALFVFLFVRECLPAARWAWSIGGLVAAFVPMMGFMSGGVNPDGMLFAVSAALFYLLARAFRRGLTTRDAVWLGVVIGIGMVAKINFYGLVPGAFVAIALAARRGEGAWDRRVVRLVGIALAIGLAPYALMTGLDAVVWGRPAILARSASVAHRPTGGLGEQLGYLWQFYLPRLPWQRVLFPVSVAYVGWFQTFIGKFGGLEVLFPQWAYRVASYVFLAVCALAVRALVVERAALRERRAELLGYLAMIGGLLLLIGMVAVRGWAPAVGAAAQGRYLLPLLALFAALLALAARGAGVRWGRAAGAVIVVTAVAWSFFAQLITVAFFYT